MNFKKLLLKTILHKYTREIGEDMIITHDLNEFLRERGHLDMIDVSFVPTMGALHEGHLALVKKAKKIAKHCIVSVFVNPLQFDQKEDFLRYPKLEKEDVHLLEQNQVDIVWFPKVEDIYPRGFDTRIEIGGPALQWEGALRKGHFSGVATVVYRLFSLVRPKFACFGEKDWQQIQVIHRMVKDLLLPVTLVNVPIVREKDGLAKSSRNRFLTSEERSRAPFLYKILQEAYLKLKSGGNISLILSNAIEALEKKEFKVDYFCAVDGNSLQKITKWNDNARLIAAVKLGSVRLLDNI